MTGFGAKRKPVLKSAASGFARGCAKTRKSQRGAELFSLLPSSEGGRQRYSFLD
jgi:hypothetical protein